MCNMIISLGFFSYLKILDFRGCQGVKGQKIAQNEKKKSYIRHAPYQEQYSIWSWVLLHILIFLVVNEVKGPKMVQNDKRLCTSSSFSQEPYIIWLSFIVHNCKTIRSPIVFFFSFSWQNEMDQNDKKICLLCSIFQEPYFIWLTFMLHICKMIVSPGIFFIF